ncbi:hypothetical protein [Rhizobium leguminosarum]|uniref:hypothetical protein n=1 Tax=Rhizobium leguminosarum TaxID=384 RepID=UPI0028F41F88|nr:hypothetical protein [Rhizobium leguminosarum]
MVYTAESDPLCYPGTTVLRNKLDLTDQSELDEFETTMFVLRSEELWPEGYLDVTHYLALHHHLFQDVYDWAGEICTIRIGKGGNWLLPGIHRERAQSDFPGAGLGGLFRGADTGWLCGSGGAPPCRN